MTALRKMYKGSESQQLEFKIHNCQEDKMKDKCRLLFKIVNMELVDVA